MLGNYVNHNLSSDDDIVEKAAFSMVSLIPKAILAVIVDLTTLVRAIYEIVKNDESAFLLFWVLWSIGIFTFVIVGIPYLRLKSIELVATKKKLIGKFGFPFAKAVDVYLERVDSFMITHSLFGKIFGYATIVIRSNTGWFRFPYVLDAVQFKNTVMRCFEERDRERMSEQADLIALKMGANRHIGSQSEIQGHNMISKEAVSEMSGQGQNGKGSQSGKMNEEDELTQAVGMLIGVGGQYNGANIKLKTNEPLTLGRDGSRAALVFSNPKVSGVHMTVTFAVNHYIVRDLSSYGVFVEYPRGQRQKLTKGTDTNVHRGSVVLFGDTERILLK